MSENGLAISSISHNEVIHNEINWFENTLRQRILRDGDRVAVGEPPEIGNADGAYAALVNKHQFNPDERLLLMLAFSIHRKPELIRLFNFEDNRASLHIQPYQNLGLPTVETFLWLLCGNNLKLRMEKDYLFDSKHILFQQNILLLENPDHLGRYHGTLKLEADCIDLFMYNEYRIPQFSPEFPAIHAQTGYNIEEVTLPNKIRSSLREIRATIEFKDYMRNELGYGRDMTPGYLALFYGAPGTGKSLTAAALGKLIDMQVFEVDISNLVSKYIGETTKNLDRLFRQVAKNSVKDPEMQKMLISTADSINIRIQDMHQALAFKQFKITKEAVEGSYSFEGNPVKLAEALNMGRSEPGELKPTEGTTLYEFTVGGEKLYFIKRVKANENVVTPSETANSLGSTFDATRNHFWYQAYLQSTTDIQFKPGDMKSKETNLLIQKAMENGWKAGDKIPEGIYNQLPKYKLEFVELPRGRSIELVYDASHETPSATAKRLLGTDGWQQAVDAFWSSKRTESYQNLKGDGEVNLLIKELLVEGWKPNELVPDIAEVKLAEIHSRKIKPIVDAARKEYNTYDSNWLKENPFSNKNMFNESSGGYVVAHKQHNNIYPHEFSMGEAYAADGYRVKLLNEKAEKNTTTPDAEIIEHGIWDFKDIDVSAKEKNLRKNVHDYILGARRQAENIAFNLGNNNSATPELINNAALDAVQTAEFSGLELPSKISVVYKNGTTKIIEISEFKTGNGDRF